MRTIHVAKIRDAVKELCLKANFELRPDVLKALKRALRKETDDRARGILADIIENASMARRREIAICQDTGMVPVFIWIGQGVRLAGGDLSAAVNEGVKRAYREGYLRTSVVDDPFLRKNTLTNTPVAVYTEIVRGSRVKIVVAPKGFGSENKSQVRMFKPTASEKDIKEFIVEVVRKAGPDACPPLVLGVGIGGTFDMAAHLAKVALLRPLGSRHNKRHIARLEAELLKRINALGIGPMALGGRTTALGVNIVTFATHIAGLPVAVNVSCHATRGAEKVL
ncbi:MAG: fumarate hydratase [Candidatus Omnitrophica bacterium]|nr:fumarate hydratase [Candidatus Omnitrophota bacterium]